MIDRLDETVVAVSSAPGQSAVGIVRLTGSRALTIADQLTSLHNGRRVSELGGFRRFRAEVHIDDDSTLPTTLFLFHEPHSYTREHLVEFHSVGSPPLLELIRRRAIELGAVDAQPGEFTARAFLNGAMDLAEAEAVAGVIRAQTDTQLRAARRLMDGAISGLVGRWRRALAELAALVEADIDFSEEPIEFITPSEAGSRLREIDAGLSGILAASVSSERLNAAPRILLLGPPNAGKSSLMNRLASVSRSICAAAAGTTRDILAAPIRLGRCEAVLLDSAGLDRPFPSLGKGEEGGVDEVLAAARAMTKREAQSVDVLCLVIDVTHPTDTHAMDTLDALGETDSMPTVVAVNKTDLLPDDQVNEVVATWTHRNLGPICPVSAATGRGVGELRARLTELIGSVATTAMGEAIALTGRQRVALAQARQAIQRGVTISETSAETIDRAELLAFEIREALDDLGALGGQVVTEDLLAQVFANFCIGK